MGLIKTEKLANGNIGLEITYGGKEAPFGGIDASMPPQYIDPLCVVDADGFVIVNGQYVAVTFQPLAITINLPASGFTAPQLAGFGSFYTEAQGWQNFAVINGDYTSGAGQASQNIAIYVWPSSNTATPPVQTLTFRQAITISAGALATAQLVAGPGTPIINPGLPIASYNVILTQGTTTETYGPYSTTDTQNAWITAVVNAITALPSVLVTAAVNADNISATLTSKVAAYASNTIQVSLQQVTAGSAFNFPGCTPYIQSEFQGGKDSFTYPSGQAPYPISWVQAGEGLYIGGPGTAIFQYVNQIFSILTQFVGVDVLRKFAGSLVGLGITPSPGTVLQNAEMMIAWSAAGNFSTWNPVDSSGNVTGAGFEQLADIGDALTGGFVNSSTIVMLRAQGVSYATATENASLPFDINHVDLASEGEGCQSPLLSSQYGPVGFYIGNSDVYEFVQNAKPIGEKIKSLLFSTLSPEVGSATSLGSSKAVSVSLLGSEQVLFATALVKGTALFMYYYNPSNNSWTQQQFGTFNADSVYLDDFPLLTSTTSPWPKQSQLVIGNGNISTRTVKFLVLTECISNTDSGMPPNTVSVLLFPSEEVSFGRDITIDGLYIKMAGTAGQRVEFDILDETGATVLFSSFTFPVGASYTVLADYAINNFTVLSGEGISTATVKAPQLKIQVFNNGTGVKNQFRLAKATLFGSFDPQQRPV